MDLLTELSLFSGAGGGLLGSKYLLGWRTVCYVEWDKYAVDVLKARIRDGYLDDAPIWDDAFTFDGRPWAGLVDVVSAGFPCQPFSVAGKGLAENDPRNGWPAVIRILREVRPRYALLENVPGLLSKPYIRTVFGDLAEAGFDAEWDCVSAAEIGANHKRDRLWIVAHADGYYSPERGKCPNFSEKGFERRNERTGSAADSEREKPIFGAGKSSDVAHADDLGRMEGEREVHTADARVETFARSSVRREEVSHAAGHELGKYGEQTGITGTGGQRNHLRDGEAQNVRGEWWAVEPELGRVADGVAHRVDRLRAIGNGQVPRVAGEAWNRLIENYKEK